MNIFSKKRALITGASGGLGTEIAVQLAEQGCSLHLIGTNQNKLEKVVERINNTDHFWGPHWLGQKVSYTTVDFSRAEQLDDFIKQDFSYDILINCAGVFPIVDICSSSLSLYEQCFDVNMKAPFLLSKYCAKYMKKNKWGRIMNVASSSAYAGSEDTGLYCASKHALLGLSRSLYKELKPHGIRVYTVSPGSIQTEMGARDIRQDFSTFLNPKEVAEYIVYIMSHNNQMISEEIRLNRMVIK